MKRILNIFKKSPKGYLLARDLKFLKRLVKSERVPEFHTYVDYLIVKYEQ